MNDGFLQLLAIVIIGLAAFDWYVWWFVRRAARIEPRIPVLNIAASRTLGIAIGVGTIGALLGVHTIVLRLTGIRIVPADLAAPLIALAILAPSLGNVPTLIQAMRWKRERERRTDDAP